MVQITVATLLGMGLASAFGWPLGGGLVFGLALSVATTVVLLRAMQERRLIDTERGRIAVGWLIVEDLAMVLTLVVLPALAPTPSRAEPASNPSALTALLWPLVLTPRQGRRLRGCDADRGPSRDPLDHALGRPYRLARTLPSRGARDRTRRRLRGRHAVRRVVRAGRLFRRHGDRESALCHRAARSRCRFGMLLGAFFVSVGMLLDPAGLLRRHLPVLTMVPIIVLGKSLAAFVIVLLFGIRRPR